MKFNAQKYNLADEPLKGFIDHAEIETFLKTSRGDKSRVGEIIEKSISKNRLTLEETAILLNAEEPDLVEEIKAGARRLKQEVYGNRVVLFAPLYVGNKCSNNCKYCGFRASNKDAVRMTLSGQELTNNVIALEENGQKRLILVFGEHRDYSAEYIANCVKKVYKIKKDNGEIRRVNINAAPLSIEDFKTVHQAGIGTYQVFQETYHRDTYHFYHTKGKKADYDYRLSSLDRAMEAGIDDVGIGALFGLYNWKFEVMGLVRHTNHLEACYNVGPHTISFPRLQQASQLNLDEKYKVSDEELTRLIAILRLAVPYTGMILTAREPEHIRREVLKYGCSQIDAGSKIEIGAYAQKKSEQQNLEKEQFLLNDNRSLGEVIDELLEDNYLPSFCTACYRKGRTGEHFMEFSVPGFIKRFCTPNAILTLAEYLEDYANEQVYAKGWKVIEKNLHNVNEGHTRDQLLLKLEKVKTGQRDLYF